MPNLLEEWVAECQATHQTFEDAIEKHLKFHLDLYNNKSVILSKVNKFREALIGFQRLIINNKELNFGPTQNAFDISKRLFVEGEKKFFVFSSANVGRLVELEVLFGLLGRAEQQKNEIEAQHVLRDIKSLVVMISNDMSQFSKYAAVALKQVRPNRLKGRSKEIKEAAKAA